MIIPGIHHITAIASDPQKNLDFYTRVLGLRLVKLTVNFEVGTDVNTDQILSQMRSNQASSQLPQDVNKFGVTVQKSTSSPLIMFALYSPKGSYDNVFLANYANINLSDEFTRVKGIASVSVFTTFLPSRAWTVTFWPAT